MFSMDLYSLLHAIISKVSGSLGFRVIKEHRIPQSCGNLLDLAVPALRENFKPINIIQIGANDGILNDPLRHHLLQGGFRGFLIEPIPAIYEILENNISSIDGIEALNVAVSDRNGTMALHLPSNFNESTKHQNASFELKNLQKTGVSRDNVQVLQVATRTVSSILKSWQESRLDLLVIDAEGHDWRILQNCFDDNIEPSVIFFEIVHLDAKQRKTYRDLLKTKGYVYVENIKDCLAVKTTLLNS